MVHLRCSALLPCSTNCSVFLMPSTMSGTLILLLFLVAATSSHIPTDRTPDGIVRIPLHRMESGLEKLLNRETDLRIIEGIYNMFLKSSRPRQTILEDGNPVPRNDTLPLFKYFDTQYYGLVNIGKPGKTFKMIMDTEWAYSWVPSSDCPSTRISCAVHSKYDHKESSTYKPDNRPFHIPGKHPYTGYWSNDVFLVGQMNSTGQQFAELTEIPWIYALYGTDGTIGLGFRDLAPGFTPFFYNFYQQNRLKDPIFSFYINRDPTTPRGGSILFGGIDPKHNKTSFTTIPVTSRYYWQFDMDKVTVIMSKKSTQDFCVKGCSALSDTSSNTIVGPADEIKEINRLIGAQEIFFSNRYMIPCKNEYKGPKVNFTISGSPFQILARDYIQKLSYSGVTVCLSAFQPADESQKDAPWILGGAFLYQYYTAYDIVNRKVYIAEAA